MTAGVLDGIGGFGGMFELNLTRACKKPVLVSGTDGVGTKLKLALLLDKHDTVGIDCVAMCVNDVICCGAKPLFFLDYIACGKNVPEKIAADRVRRGGGLRAGGLRPDRRRNRRACPASMPEEDYDLAGFSVGVVDKEKIIDRERDAARGM